MGGVLLESVQESLLWGSQNIMDFVDLVKLVSSREEGEERKDFKENAAHSPNVHFVAVVAVSQKTLRGSIPSSRDILSKRGLGINPSAGAKVSQFNGVVEKEDVLRFDVSMEDTISMHVVNGLHKLIDIEFDSVLREVMGPSLYGLVHVHFHQLKDQGQSSCGLVVKDFEESDDVGMGRESLEGLDLPQLLNLL